MPKRILVPLCWGSVAKEIARKAHAPALLIQPGHHGFRRALAPGVRVAAERRGG